MVEQDKQEVLSSGSAYITMWLQQCNNFLVTHTLLHLPAGVRMEPKWALNSKSFYCFYLLSAGIAGTHYQAC